MTMKENLHKDNERQQIAKNGFEKVKRKFSYDIQLEKMMRLAFEDEIKV